MIFSSYSFLFGFLPITLAGYYLLQHFYPPKAPRLWLVATSLVFYGMGDLQYVSILMFTALFSFLIAEGMHRFQKQRVAAALLLAVGLAENLGLLFYFKYTNFFLENINFLFDASYPLVQRILPLGISFYTFQIISYLINTWRGETEQEGLLNYLVFVTFFPQLIVGPVMQYEDMMDQLHQPAVHKINQENICRGILLFSMGSAKKILLADPMIAYAQNFYNVMGTGNFFETWGAVFSYTFAYYFDFSGYVDMALGLGLFFNIELPINFNSPYKSTDFADFWRRWNITISRFFNDYVFRNLFHFGDGIIKLIFATMVTFLVSGLWHGAGWHFIAWGAFNGVMVSIANIMTIKGKKLPKPLAWASTFLLMLLSRVLFDSNNMTQALFVYRTMFDLNGALAAHGSFLGTGLSWLQTHAEVAVLLVVGAIICFFLPNSNEIAQTEKLKWYHPLFSGVLLACSLLCMSQVSQFLYFQF